MVSLIPTSATENTFSAHIDTFCMIPMGKFQVRGKASLDGSSTDAEEVASPHRTALSGN